MRSRLVSTLLALSVLCGLPASGRADEQPGTAEKTLARAFSCPTPSSNQADQPEEAITKAKFSGNGTGFRVILDARMLLDTGGLSSEPNTGKVEAHQHSVVSADYGDLARVEVMYYGRAGRGVFKKLKIECRSGQECFHSLATLDAGPPVVRRLEHKSPDQEFEFCDEDTLQNAKAAFDALIGH
jgi:hypothetical protein